MRPIRLSGVQLARPMRPPGRTTRAISAADRAWSGANITPKVETTASKLASAKGSASTSATWKVDVQPLGARPLGAALEQAAHVVGGGDDAAAARGGERGIAIAGSHVEHALVGLQIAGLGERLADDLQRGADDGVVAGAPGGLLAGLEGGEVDGCVHGSVSGGGWQGRPLSRRRGCTSCPRVGMTCLRVRRRRRRGGLTASPPRLSLRPRVLSVAGLAVPGPPQ